MSVESHFYNQIFSLKLYLCASQADLGILGSKDLTVAASRTAGSVDTGYPTVHYCLSEHCHRAQVLDSYFIPFFVRPQNFVDFFLPPVHIRRYNMYNVFYVCIYININTHLTNIHRLPNFFSKPCSSFPSPFLRIQAYFELKLRV